MRGDERTERHGNPPLRLGRWKKIMGGEDLLKEQKGGEGRGKKKPWVLMGGSNRRPSELEVLARIREEGRNGLVKLNQYPPFCTEQKKRMG